MQLSLLMCATALAFAGPSGKLFFAKSSASPPVLLSQETLREFTFKADVGLAVGAFMIPGDRVDVFLREGAGGALILIHSDLHVIASHRTHYGSDPIATVLVTVKADRKVADKLVRAQEAGRLSIMLAEAMMREH